MVTRAISLTGDAIAIVVAHLAAKTIAQHIFNVAPYALSPRHYAAFYLPFLLGVLFVFERNQRPELRRPEKELELAVKGMSLGFVLLVCANFVVFKAGFSRYVILGWYLLTLVLLLAVRYGLRLSYGALWRRGIAQKRTLLVGSAHKLFELQTLLTIQRYRGYELIGIVPALTDAVATVNGDALPIIGSIDKWHNAVRDNRAEQVILALDRNTAEAHKLVADILKTCLAEGVDVQVYSDLFASREFNYELDEFSGFFRFFATPRWSKQVQLAAKAVLDLSAGLAGSLFTVVIIPFVGFAIKLEDGGPIFYRSKYIDRNGRVATCLKFRTMCVNAEQILLSDPQMRAKFEEKFKLVDDPRVLRVGQFLRKYSIDELPQFFSVLTGRISLVGPRILAANQTRRYGDSIGKLLSVKPGLTGFWQVMGRQATTYDLKVQMDMFYIDHWSIWLDLWIVAKTFGSVLRAEGAY
jgi:exopolysaccharide biosynthesis polyprenyl glycosylphosphotransferase